jgi:hypothetical protein
MSGLFIHLWENKKDEIEAEISDEERKQLMDDANKSHGTDIQI